MTIPGTKRCSTCRENLTLDNFAYRAAANDRRQSRCRVCYRIAYRAQSGRQPSRGLVEMKKGPGGFQKLHTTKHGMVVDVTRSGTTWQPWEDALATDPKMSTAQVAQRTRRTEASVRQRRTTLHFKAGKFVAAPSVRMV